MKRSLVYIILVVLTLVAIPASAQTTKRIHALTVGLCDGTIYNVVHGDVLYAKFGPKWVQLLDSNPDLKYRTDGGGGDTVVMLYESRGDQLCIPKGMQVGEFVANNGKPVQQANPDNVSGTGPDSTNGKIGDDSGEVKTATTWYTNPWFVVPLGLLLLLIFGFLAKRWIDRREARRVAERERQEEAERAAARERELTQHPVTSGPPIVAGGIQPTEEVRLANHFQDRAVAQYVRANAGTDATSVRPNIVRVGPIEEVMIVGEGMVGYADRARPRRINVPTPGYRATFRFPDGSEQQLLSLQGCMNPCMWGEGMTGFTVTVGHVVVPAPEPERPAPQAVPHPAIAVARIRTAAEAEGASTILVGGEMITIRQGAHFDFDRTPGSITVTGPSFETTFKLKRQRKTTKVGATRTGTSD